MREVKISEIYEYASIVQDKAWRDIYNKLEEKGLLDCGEDIELIFKDIFVLKPYRCDYFKRLIRHENIHITFYDKEDDVKYTKIACMLDGINPDKIKNVETFVKKEKKEEDKNLEKNVSKIYDIIKLEEGSNTRAVLPMHQLYQNINNSLTPTYMKKALDVWLSENQEVKNVTIEFKEASMIERVIDLICEAKVDLGKTHGVNIDIDVDNENIINMFELYIYKYTSSSYSYEDRVEALKGLKKGTAGILVKYKQTKAVDAFGRKGKGETVSSRAAIYRGLVRNKNNIDNGEIYARFEVYFGDTLYTKEHSILTTGDEHPGLKFAKVDISMDKIGLMDMFIGSDYHFILPMQKEAEESKKMHTIENGVTAVKEFTIPELMKEVFDDFDVEYDVESLDRAIAETRKYLESNSKKDL